MIYGSHRACSPQPRSLRALHDGGHFGERPRGSLLVLGPTAPDLHGAIDGRRAEYACHAERRDHTAWLRVLEGAYPRRYRGANTRDRVGERGARVAVASGRPGRRARALGCEERASTQQREKEVCTHAAYDTSSGRWLHAASGVEDRFEEAALVARE